MSHTEPTAQTPSSKTGLVATLRVLHVRGSGAPSPYLVIAPAEQAHLPSLVGLRRRAGLALAPIAAAACALAFTAAPASAAEPCPNETLRAQQGSTALPDCRAYEQVSPVDKNAADAVGGVGAVHASPNGSGVTYASQAPFPQSTGSQGSVSFYLSLRSLSPDGWSTFGLTPPTEPGPGRNQHGQNYVSGSTEDLTKTVVGEDEQALAPGATPGKFNAYVRDNSTGAYQLLAGDFVNPNLDVLFADAVPGGARIIFETREELSVSGGPQPAPGVTNLYEWNEAKPPSERLTVAGVLPPSEGGEAPAGGSYAGGAGVTNHASTQHTISQDGSRIFFTDAGTGRIYMRLPQPEPALTIPISPGLASWQATTPSGSFVFYAEAGELYRFNVDGFEKSVKPEPEALADAREQLTSGAGGLQGTLGVSDDGAYAYFIAPGVLATNKREYKNTNGEDAVEEALTGARNLYLWHEAEPSLVFIAGLGTPSESESGGARVTPDGRTILFASLVPLTGYVNGSKCTEIVGTSVGTRNEPCNEFFRYTTDSGRLSCVSCSPVQTIVTDEPFFTRQDPTLTVIPRQKVSPPATHNLSDDGLRVFFETPEALVPQDQNGQTDVYEWEAGGAGSCTAANPTFDIASAGCLYLISTGRSAQQSYFGDASADGASVYFFTRQSLVSQDQDDSQDLYHARATGGIVAQNPLPASPCAADACRDSVVTPPTFGLPASASLSGTGNLKKRCAKGRKLRHGRCVKARSGKKTKARKTGKKRRGRR